MSLWDAITGTITAPGDYTRGLFAGRLGDRVSPRELLNTYGMDPGDGLGGFGADFLTGLITDPLTYALPLGAGWAASKMFPAARGAAGTSRGFMEAPTIISERAPTIEQAVKFAKMQRELPAMLAARAAQAPAQAPSHALRNAIGMGAGIAGAGVGAAAGTRALGNWLADPTQDELEEEYRRRMGLDFDDAGPGYKGDGLTDEEFRRLMWGPR